MQWIDFLIGISFVVRFIINFETGRVRFSLLLTLETDSRLNILLVFHILETSILLAGLHILGPASTYEETDITGWRFYWSSYSGTSIL